MKALIFNSGIGKRMLELTANCPKSMVHLYNDETIFERQIRLLQEAGIKDVVITTGPYPEMIKNICSKPCYSNMNFEFPHNEIYDSSNYIYSMYKARDLLDDDVLMMHGDLVFDRSLIPAMLKSPKKDLCLINKFKSLPEKDFKGRIINNNLREVGINIFDENCFAFQPLYKLSKTTMKAWLDNVAKFVENNNINVYAENAFNEISENLHIFPMSYANHFIDEVDNKDDLARVSSSIENWDFKKQQIYQTTSYVKKVNSLLEKIHANRPFIVVDSFLQKRVNKSFKNAVVFSGFTSNPKYEEMLAGLKLFKDNNCDVVISIGGGSCIDVAKAIKLSLNSDTKCDKPTFRQNYIYNSIKHICLPTTSGTGSESTRHSVLYLNGVKQSICNSAILPDYVILNPKFVLTVPSYQKKCTAMDAFCQCIESLWSKKANKVSKKYATKGIELFKNCYKGYLSNDFDSVKQMQLVANFSGKAINISETTAAHALSYKITSLYGIPHGHAVAICMNALLEKNGSKLKCKYKELFDKAASHFDLNLFINEDPKDIDVLVSSVNLDRLSNFPISIDIFNIYRYIFRTY